MGAREARWIWVTVVAALGAACSRTDDAAGGGGDAGVAWITTGARASFPSALAVDKATAITIDGTYIYWITTDGFLYRAPRAAGDVSRVPLPAPATLLGAHNDVFVGWTDDGGNAAIAAIDPATGKTKAVNHQPGKLRGLVAGQRGYSFASTTADGTLVQTCLEADCTKPPAIPSDFKSLALDLPTKTFYVLTADGLRTCTLSGGCPAQAASLPAATSLIAALPGTTFLLDSSGQALGQGGSPKLASAVVPDATKLVVVDGNGKTTSPVGTWSNGKRVAQALLTPGATTTELPNACTDIDVDATGRPIYCLVGASRIEIIP